MKFFTARLSVSGLCSGILGYGTADVVGFGKSPAKAIRDAVAKVNRTLGARALPTWLSLTITSPQGVVLLDKVSDRARHGYTRDAFFPLTNREGFVLPEWCVGNAPISLNEEMRRDLIRSLPQRYW